jgi:bisphosphoglycerate-dependent phosphoglycerate mutase
VEKMSKNSSKESLEIINVNAEIIDTQKTSSFGKTLVIETGKAVIPVIADYMRQRLASDLEIQKQIRNDKRLQLNQRAESLLTFIDKEEAKENFDQQRIDRWCEELEEIWKKQDELDAKSDGFVKVMLNKFFNW